MELCIWPWASGVHEGVEGVEDNRQACLLSGDAGTKVPWRNGGQEGQVVAAGLGFDVLHSIR